MVYISKAWDEISGPDFSEIVGRSGSLREVVDECRQIVPRIGVLAVKKKIEHEGLSVEHFRPRGTRKGSFRLDPLQVLTKNSTKTGSQARKAFRMLGSDPYQCKLCDQPPEWMGQPLIMILDHIDGDNRNHSPKNLRWLCPNCNIQTETFCGRNHA